MSLERLYASRIEESIQRQLRNPGPAPEVSFSLWSAIGAGFGGLPAGGLEASGSTADFLSGFGTSLATLGGSAGGMFAMPTDAERAQQAEAQKRMRSGDLFDTAAGNVLRRRADEFMPNPETSHKADQVVAGLTRFAGKAVAATVTMGPAVGATVLGLEEGNTATQRLRAEGVDTATAAKVGAMHGAVSAVGAVLPISGAAVPGSMLVKGAATTALVATGGPVAFMAEEGVSREILQRAGYDEQALQHDPFDPLGLTLSTLLPGAFGAVGMRGAVKRGRAVESGGIGLPQMTVEERRGLKYGDARLDRYAEAAAEREGVPPAILLAIKNAGEKSDPTATSPKGAQGVMQFMPATAKEMGITDPTDPVQSIDGAARYMRKLFDAYGSWDAAVAHYNGGGAQAALVRGGAKPSFPETAAYLERVQQYVREHTTDSAAARPEVVDAARVQVLNETLARSLPDTPDAAATVMRAADIVAEGKIPEVDPWDIEPPPRTIDDLAPAADVAEDLRGMGRMAFWAQQGGTIIRSGESMPGDGGMGGDVVGRTKWIPAEEWFGRMRSDLGRDGLTGQPEIQEAIERAIAGEKLTAKQKRTVDWIRTEVDDMQQRMRAAEFAPDDADGLARSAFDAGLSSKDADDVSLVARAAEKDADAVERAALMYEDDDAAFLAAIREIVGEDSAAPATRQPGPSLGEGRAAARPPTAARDASNALPDADSVTPAPGAARAPSEASAGDQSLDAQLAQRLAAEQPDLAVILPGSDEPISLREAMERIKEQQADEAADADLVRVAAECALTA